MPQDVQFDLPFPRRVNPEMDDARRRHAQWVTAVDLIRFGPVRPVPIGFRCPDSPC